MATKHLVTTSLTGSPGPARCCPTRASLLTGHYPHGTGVGHRVANPGTLPHQGFPRNDSVTIAEALRETGYRTLMSGKWHVAGDFVAWEVESWRNGEVDHPIPRQRGFERYNGNVDGATNIFSPHFILADELPKYDQDWAENIGVLDWHIALLRLLHAWKVERAEG